MDWSNNGASAPGPSLSGTSRPELLSAKKVEFKLASLTGFCRNSYDSWLFPFPASQRTENLVDNFHVGKPIFKGNGNSHEAYEFLQTPVKLASLNSTFFADNSSGLLVPDNDGPGADAPLFRAHV